MRILVDSGDHTLVDKGRVARIEVTLRRLREMWPSAEIGLLTDQLTQAALFFPETTAVPYSGEGGWPDTSRVGLLKTSGPEFGLDGQPLSTDAPSLQGSSDTSPLRTATTVPRGVIDADIVALAGGVDFTDVAADEVSRSLSVLEGALRAGARVAMFGYSFGPFERPDLVARAAEVLPRLEVITVRDGVQSPRVLGLLGVPAHRISVTGDDALDLTTPDPSGEIGNELGINLRLSDYANLAPEQALTLASSVREIADINTSALTPIYISEHNDEDRLGTLKLVGDYPIVRNDYGRYAPPAEIAERISRCRVLLTGSASAAALALSQGVPTVGLPRTDYDLGGFDGLAAQYPTGCRIVPLSTTRLDDRLIYEASSLWAESPGLRTGLVASSVGHVATGQAAYRRLYAAVEGRSLPAVAA